MSEKWQIWKPWKTYEVNYFSLSPNKLLTSSNCLRKLVLEIRIHFSAVMVLFHLSSGHLLKAHHTNEISISIEEACIIDMNGRLFLRKILAVFACEGLNSKGHFCFNVHHPWWVECASPFAHSRAKRSIQLEFFQEGILASTRSTFRLMLKSE